MSVRLDRPPIPLSNRFACLEEDDKIRYSAEELLEIRETLPKEDLKMKAMIEAIIGKDSKPAPERADRKFRPKTVQPVRQSVVCKSRSAQQSSQDVRVYQAAKRKLPSHSKDPAFRHFHTKKVWMPKNPPKK